MNVEIKRRVMRPGPGWKHFNGPVWEHENGTRIHIGGMVRLPNYRIISTNKSPEMFEAERFIKINGGNQKRGLMAYSLNFIGA